MRSDAWEELTRADFPVPAEPPLSELTAELTEMLGHPDSEVREGTALATLRAWVARGVYDDLLPGLGDGMTAGLTASLPGRRGCSAAVLGHVIARDGAVRRVADEQVITWGDRLVTWWLAETDGPAIGRGAVAIEDLAAHPACTAAELQVVLEVIGERAATVRDEETADRLAGATLAILRRDLVPVEAVEQTWERLDTAGTYLRSLYLHLGLVPDPPPHRADLLLLVIDRLRTLHPRLRTSE